ncbi:MAG: xanthine dehydrogenase accessory protein XdhC [Gammaproteobacteria bacterium]|nr:xanthine dehydrogenase accessory protein XdhC [Gammaproteobacteria bacterium]
MKAWLAAQWQCEQQNSAYVLVSIVALKGSSPRGIGSKILVTANEQFDSIGGGHLEYKAIAQARELLAEGGETQLIDYPLGASLGQCCGGKVSVMFEVFSATKMPVVVFGAGHVGRALVPLLAQLPVAVTWVDSRYDMLPKALPAGVVGVHEEHPQDHVEDCVAGSCYLIMTHHHGVDFALAQAVLNRGDAGYLGVIGSVTKGRKFRQRLVSKDYSQQTIDGLNCPMGKVGISGKQPMEVAIAIAAQVMELYQNIHINEHAVVAEEKPANLTKEILEHV